MRRMFVFPWQGHYEEYYVMGCGGYVGSPLGTFHYHAVHRVVST
jgi:hypothetical protein